MAVKQIGVVLSFSCLLFAIIQPASAAGTKKKPTKSDPALPTVEKVLRVEVAGVVDRRSQLAETLKQQPDSAVARWQAGFVKDGDSWKSFDQPEPGTASASLLEEYRRRRDEAPQSFSGQTDLANWCRNQRLKDQERAHLWVALSLGSAADRPTLLERLRYQPIGNQWLSHDDLVAWQLLNRRIEGAIRKVGPKLEMIADRIDGSQRQHDAAVASLVKIADPDAIPAIQYTLSGRDEACAEVAVDTWGKVESCEATAALAQAAVFSKWPEFRRRATTLLKTRRFDDFVPALIQLLGSPITVTSNPRLVVRLDGPYMQGGGGYVQLILLTNFIVARETDDQFQVSLFHSLDFRLNQLLQGGGVSLDKGLAVGGPRPTPARTLVLKEFERSDAAESHYRDRIMDDANERVDELNRRVVDVLAGATGRAPTPDPAGWWKWWADYCDLQQSGSKPVVVVSEESAITGNPSFALRRASCFASGTPVWTESGRRPLRQSKSATASWPRTPKPASWRISQYCRPQFARRRN
jgi:hypothetical protein